jgi:tetratricopeptide (TPR) repeat protein
VLVALAAIAIDDNETAERAAREAVRLAPIWAPYHVVHAQALLGLGRHEDATGAAEQARELDPESADAAAILAAVYALRGRHDRAREAAAEALALDPSADHAHTSAGFAALARGDDKEAVARFREALRLDPTDESARIGLVESLKARNPVYGALIRFFLWQARLPSGVQTTIAFSPLIVTFVVRALGLRDEPVGLAIIGVVIFALIVMWSAEPLMNLVLLATREGAIILDAGSRRSALLFLGFVAGAVASVVAAVLGAPPVLYGIAIGFTIFALGVGSSHHLAGLRRRLVQGSAIALPVCAGVAVGVALLASEQAANVLAVPIVLVGIASLWVVRFG